MERAATTKSRVDEAAESEAQIDHYIAEMERIHKGMTEDQREIEKLQAEIRAMLAELKVA